MFFLSLQFGANSKNDVLHIILLIIPIPSLPVHTFDWRLLGGRLKKHHAVELSEAHCPLLAHLVFLSAGVTEVTLVTHQEPGRRTGSRKGQIIKEDDITKKSHGQRMVTDLETFNSLKSAASELMQLPGDFLSNRVLPTLFYPGNQASEAGRAGDIIYEEHSMDVPVVVLHHGLPKALLSGRVPQLELMARRGRERRKRNISMQAFHDGYPRGGEVVLQTQMQKKEETNEEENTDRKRNHVLKYPRAERGTQTCTEAYTESSWKGNKEK